MNQIYKSASLAVKQILFGTLRSDAHCKGRRFPADAHDFGEFFQSKFLTSRIEGVCCELRGEMGWAPVAGLVYTAGVTYMSKYCSLCAMRSAARALLWDGSFHVPEQTKT